MAKQKGILPLTGTLDALNFYMRKGLPVVRKAGGGFTTKALLKSPNMVRIREAGTEFGHTSRMKKLFRKELLSFFGYQQDETLHSRMMQLFLRIKDLDEISVRGERKFSVGLQTDTGKKMLTCFAFTNLKLDLSNQSYNAVNYNYNVSDLKPNELCFPNGATHLELQLDVLFFDTIALKAERFSSEALSISKLAPPSSISLSPIVPPIGAGICITVLSYQYTQEKNARFYPLQDKAAYGVKILDIVS